MLQEHSFDTGVLTINYAGGPSTGPPLVLLHGLPGTWQEFLPVIPALSLRWQVYALDARGQGKSGRVPGQYRPQDYVDDVKAFLQGQLTEPAVLYGHSAGGLVALTVAARHPTKVRAVAVGDFLTDRDTLVAWMSTPEFTHYFSTLRDLAGPGRSVPELARALGDIPISVPGQEEPIRNADRPGMDDAHLRHWAKTMRQLDPGVLEHHAEGRAHEFLEDFDLETLLRQITCPVLLLQGNPELGALTSTQAVKLALSVLPDVAHVVIDAAGHDLGLDTWQVAPLLRAVTNFFESL